MKPIYANMIKSLLEIDLYKLSMGQAIYHQFPGYENTWAFKCRDKDRYYTPAMVEEIRAQIKAYCDLRFTEEELDYLRTIKWLKKDYIDFLRIWRPRFEDFIIDTDDPCGLRLEVRSTWLNTTMYEIPSLAIISEVYDRMQTEVPYEKLLEDFIRRTDEKFEKLKHGTWYAGHFSEFGLRRRLSFEAQDYVVMKFSHLNDTMHSPSTFVGTSNVYLAWKHGLTPVGTMAHEWIMCTGQGDHKHDPAWSNWFALEAWVKEYGILNGTALTDTIGTDVFLRDFQLTFATLFSGVRHDSGDPFEWGEKMIAHYESLGIDPKTKTLLFSDSLNFEKATKIYDAFRGRAKVAFGIGTYLSHDTLIPAPNIVMKVIECNGWPVAKLSDTPGKGMCRSEEYIEHLKAAIDWRMAHEYDAA